MSDTNTLTTLSDARYLQTPEYKTHVENMLASYYHPTGILGELVSQMADAFWWVRIYRTQKDQLLIRYMTDALAYKHSEDEEGMALWLALHEVISKAVSNASLTGDEDTLLTEYMVINGHNLNTLRSSALTSARNSNETLDRLIERQFKNIKLLMQAYDSVRFAPQIHKRMALEIEQLEQQVKQAREDQRLEVDRQ